MLENPGQQPATNILGRVESVDTDGDSTHISVTDHEGETLTIISQSSIDVEEENWYFFTGLEPVDDGSMQFMEGTSYEHRGTDDELDDWIYVAPDIGGGRRYSGTQLSGGGSQQSSPTVGSAQFQATSSSSMDASESLDKQNLRTTAADASVDSVSADAADPSPEAAASETVGMAVGGEKDGNNFRDNIHEGYVPEPAAISPEGIFYDYYFDTGDDNPRDSLFYPSYSHSITYNPVKGEIEDYLTVGLNSNLAVEDFERKQLNLAVVIDISGSMGADFSEYYYDGTGRKQEADGETGQSKIDAAIDAVTALTEHLNDDDRLGVVLYNNESKMAKPLRDVERTDMDAIRDHIEDLEEGGGTNLEAGFEEAVEMLEPAAEEADPVEEETRVMFLTDQMPNTGETDASPLVEQFQNAADKGIYTTFIGVGLDTNAELGDQITDVRGANHYFVHSADEFRQRLDDEFEYMVTPLVYDLELHVEPDGYEIEEVYGAPTPEDNDSATLMEVSTLFPSPSEGGKNKGGVILIKLKKTGDNPGLGLKTAWEYRDGSAETDVVTPDIADVEPEHFDSNGIRKAVALGRYAVLLTEWAESVRETAASDDESAEDVGRSEWEHQSVSLTAGEYEEELREMRDYLADEADAVDSELEQEVEVLDEILDS